MTAVATSFILLSGAGIMAALPASATVPTAPAGPAPAAPAAAGPAHGDFNGDGYLDLVVAAPDATVGGSDSAGYVSVLYGSSSGVNTAKRTVINQSSAGVPGTPETGDAFGESVASGDFDGDGYADLAVGSPGEDVGEASNTGGATVLWGSPTGVSGNGSTWLQGSTPTADDAYGIGAAGSDIDGNGSTELTVLTKSGLELYSFAGGRPGARSAGRTADQSAKGAQAPSELSAEDGFVPTGPTTGDYNKDGKADLVILGTKPDLEKVVGWSVYLRGSDEGLLPGAEFEGGTTGTSSGLTTTGSWTFNGVSLNAPYAGARLGSTIGQ
ncbi:FG-GAP repeat protein [Streptomyces sp. H27-D2]|uniref:FG-GAP repeat protein n=1 Tax=Streptomyces sp. H27-D2 TaxID=3046304 RepID=UPI002DC05157|nr:FG-GAP repeat protein [Streptomyces sp. H27-D2]MEC4017577.1 FG-GAP repeat protein [Streptomyces sp. H27-D2]